MMYSISESDLYTKPLHLNPNMGAIGNIEHQKLERRGMAKGKDQNIPGLHPLPNKGKVTTTHIQTNLYWKMGVITEVVL
jgi:hypothetical protein